MDSFPDSVPSPSVSVANSEPAEEGERISRSPYTARLLGWSDEELASRDFFRLVEAIRWLTDAEESGALARRAGIYSAKDELVWARMFEPKDEQRERVMKYNAARILAHVDNAARDYGRDNDRLVRVYDSAPLADLGPDDDFIPLDR